jgi:transposase
MTFSANLRASKGDLTSRQVAARISPLLSHRIVEHWLAAYRTPPKWAQEWILAQASNGSSAKINEKQHEQI